MTNEYAWGNNKIHEKFYMLNNAGQRNEKIINVGVNTGNAVHVYSRYDPIGPSRCGVFGDSAITKTREETGATFYGIMDMSGNLWEFVISVGHPEGREFAGIHGNGRLLSDGNADVLTWPGSDSIGIGYRGGGFSAPPFALRVSDRVWANLLHPERNDLFSCRAVRSAP